MPTKKEHCHNITVFNGPYYDIVVYSLFIFVVISLMKNRNIKNLTLYNFQT